MIAGCLNGNGKAAGSATQQDAENGMLVAFGGNKVSGQRQPAAGLNGRSTARQDFETETFIVRTAHHGVNGIGVTRDVAHALNGGPEAVCFGSKDHGADAGGLAPTLRAGVHRGSHANAGVPSAVAFNHQAGGSKAMLGISSERTTALGTTQTPAIAHTLRAEGFDGSEDGSGRGTPLVPAAGSVRRLTPIECERLMGWPDDFTRWGASGKRIADAPRYRLCGNGVVASVAEWLARRLEAAP